MEIMLVNDFNQVKKVKVGFSWTTLFFGCLTPLFRGDFKWAIAQFILAFVTVGLSHIFFAFKYNEYYINDLISKGYRPVDDVGERLLITKGYIVKPIENKEER